MKSIDIDFLLKAFPFWKSLKQSDSQQLIENIQMFTYKKGDRIQNGADNCTGVMAIKKGQLRIYIMSDEGREITLYRLLDGDVCILSASCILKNISFDMYIDAETDTELYIIKAAAYSALSKKYIEVEAFISETVAARFSDAMWVMEQILFMKLDKRLAIFLLEEANLEGSDTLSITHEQIANHIGSAREAVTRMLKYFQKEGIISTSRRGIDILNRKKLNVIAN
jgi:CRP/FNR family transcriptional regulator